LTIKIEISNANIFEQKVDAWVNPVNCVGVMGAGLALAFKKYNKLHYYTYKVLCDDRKILPGKVFVYMLNNDIGPDYIIDFPTKDHWRDPSKLEYIELGMLDLVSKIEKYEIKSIAIPALGCGLGGLDWKEVRPIIVDSLLDIKTDLYVLLLKTD
jgi:O-acetyl-ADP-ribose deacetylase (regulator of RNase III)